MRSVKKILLEFDPESRNLLPALKKISADFGLIDYKQSEIVAEYFNLPLSRVFEVASFYDLTPVTKSPPYIIQICSSPNCCYRGSSLIIKSLENLLKVREGDNMNPRIKLESISCLGLCAEGPVMSINGKLFTNVNHHLAIDLIKKYIQV
jgi:NADH:ubiquinone oxidoreductase subunit E